MVKPEIGVSMLYCLNRSFNEMVEELPKTGVARIEVVDEGLHSLDKQRTSILQDVGESYGLKYSVHAPFADVNIASLSKTILATVLRRLEKSISHARLLDAYMWVFHPGTKTDTNSPCLNKDWLQNLKTVSLLLKIAENHGVKMAVENVPESYPFLMTSVEDFQRFYSELDEDLGLTLDIGHAHISGQIEKFLTTFSDKIVHIHASDNHGKTDQHLGIGCGTINWKSVAELLNKIIYDKVFIIESGELIRESKQKLENIFI